MLRSLYGLSVSCILKRFMFQIEIVQCMEDFVVYWCILKGDEKGESQVFLDWFFQVFGYVGYKEVGVELEYWVVKQGGGKKFVDLLWWFCVLIEMKKCGEKLVNYYQQVFDYWFKLVLDCLCYVVLCNFDELWVYDFNQQFDELMDWLWIEELFEWYMVLNFMFEQERVLLFGNNWVDVICEVVDSVVKVFNSVIVCGEDCVCVQCFFLQCVMVMFVEDFELILCGFFIELVDDVRVGWGSSFDFFGGLFWQMNIFEWVWGGCFVFILYFNGGLFCVVDFIEFNCDEFYLLYKVVLENNWVRIQLQIFGVLFQSSMDKKEQYVKGVYYISEVDIMWVVLFIIVILFQW